MLQLKNQLLEESTVKYKKKKEKVAHDTNSMFHQFVY